MKAMNPIAAWLNEISMNYGVALSLDENQSCRFVINGESKVYVYADTAGESFWLNVKVMDVPAQEQTCLFRRALKLNLFQQQTYGASLAFDEQSNTLLLSTCRKVSESGCQQFQNMLKNLSEVATEIRSSLSQSQQIQTAQTSFNPLLMLSA